MTRSVPAGYVRFPTISLPPDSGRKFKSGNGQELIGYFHLNSSRNPAARNLPEPTGIGENCAGIDKSCTGTDPDFNGSTRRNYRPGKVTPLVVKYEGSTDGKK
ncbi:unnamed protein product [Adineta ricciae]|uniref:Uncharacterized protein n=1 Tax=Adineta ricciae TaxID=249248 RepID=A0A816EIB4_ADIRI|nr:unnamed protein product [Adineta ricciae]CAF1646361.1 unnamed protein product [Adineta ricciae]